MKKVCLKKINLLIGAILVLMGFSASSCRVLYGCPPEIDPQDSIHQIPPETFPQSNEPETDTNSNDNSFN